MKNIKMKLLLKWLMNVSALALLIQGTAFAAGGGVELKTAHININDKASLQRGAKIFTDYCLGCHSANFVRFNSLEKDLQLTEEQIMNNLNNIGAKYGDTMERAMTAEYAKNTFGAVPPDLSLVGRSRGADWLFTYLTGFYSDPTKITGANNIAFKDVGMPNVLWELQGTQEAELDDHGKVVSLKQLKPGKMTQVEFESLMHDLVNFLNYISEPKQYERKIMGIWVLAFLFVLFILSYALKKEYWKDVPH